MTLLDNRNEQSYIVEVLVTENQIRNHPMQVYDIITMQTLVLEVYKIKDSDIK